MEGTKEEEDVRIILSANSFYGTRPGPSHHSARTQGRINQVAVGAEHISRHHLPSEFRPGIFGPPATWKVFKRQSEAIKYAQLMREGLMVFSFEGEALGSGGKRNFVVTHPAQMWLRQNERVAERRCFYEVIQEKSVCKLYFDLEFLHTDNPGRDGVAMTNTLLRIVCHLIGKEFGVACSRKDVLDLRGTSDLKFSRHLIFNLPGSAFANNTHVGCFIKMVCNKIRLWKEGREPIETPHVSLQEVKDLFVLNSRNCELLFCDEGVYTKNRNFRLFLSTKYGQNYPLIIAEENEYVPSHGSGHCKEEQIFFDSLITLVDSKKNFKILTYEDPEQTLKESEHTRSNTARSTDPVVEGSRQSPYPEIDDFIQRKIGSGNIHSWHYFSQSEVIVYNIVRYRFCHNIGREHKSNNILYVVNLKSASYYQKCHDPDCRDFRSPSWPLPQNTVFWQNMNEEEMVEWVQSSLEEEDNVNKTLDVEMTSTPNDEMENHQVNSVGMEKWSHIEELISSQGSIRSLKSSQGSSSSSNPWDKLSELSSPSPSFIETLSQLSQSNSKEVEEGIYDFDTELSDEEFVRVACMAEEQVCREMEISC